MDKLIIHILTHCDISGIIKDMVTTRIAKISGEEARA